PALSLHDALPICSLVPSPLRVRSSEHRNWSNDADVAWRGHRGETRRMKRMLNAATDFREEMIDGFVAAYGRYVRRVPGASGIAAIGSPVPGQVGVVVGGGSGHYPAFYGLVGEGMASAAVIGDIFTSPSGEQAYRVAEAVDGGAGILFSF